MRIAANGEHEKTDEEKEFPHKVCEHFPDDRFGRELCAGRRGESADSPLPATTYPMNYHFWAGHTTVPVGVLSKITKG